MKLMEINDYNDNPITFPDCLRVSRSTGPKFNSNNLSEEKILKKKIEKKEGRKERCPFTDYENKDFLSEFFIFSYI